MYQIYKTIHQFFKQSIASLADMPDPRKSKQYEIDEIVFSGVALFLLKETSRNAFNNDRKDSRFAENIQELFSKKIAHMDSVKDVFCDLMPQELETFKADMITNLIRKKVLLDYRYKGKYLIAIDKNLEVKYDPKIAG